MVDPSQTANSGPSARKKKESLTYPAPFIISSNAQHKQTLILLHGRGSNGESFGTELLKSKTSTSQTLQELFPSMKFIFPTAKNRRAKWYNRASINQWFDNVPIDEQSKRQMSREEIEWQIEGLVETGEFMRKVLDEEVGAVGAENVFLGGLSQGCAMGLHLLLSYQPDGGEGVLGGFIGMSGWLPFCGDMRRLISPGEGSDKDEDDPFATSDDENDGERLEIENSKFSPASQVCNFVRENMDMPPLATMKLSHLQTSVFLGHGRRDGKVKMELGLEAANVLRDIGMRVKWEEYDEGHWYKVPEQIDDLVDFLKTYAGPAA